MAGNLFRKTCSRQVQQAGKPAERAGNLLCTVAKSRAEVSIGRESGSAVRQKAGVKRLQQVTGQEQAVV